MRKATFKNRQHPKRPTADAVMGAESTTYSGDGSVVAGASDRLVTSSDNRAKIDKLSVEDLIVDHADLAASLRDLTARAATLPAEPTPETSLASLEANGVIIATFGRDVQKFISSVADRHSTTKAPYREIGDLIDAHFNKGMRDVALPFSRRAAALAARFVDEKDNRVRAEAAAEQARLKKEEDDRLALAAQAEEKGDHTTAEVLVAQAENSERKANHAASIAAAPRSLGAFSTVAGSMGVKKTLGFDVEEHGGPRGPAAVPGHRRDRDGRDGVQSRQRERPRH